MAEIGLQRPGVSAPNSPGHSRKHVSAPATKAGNRIYGTPTLNCGRLAASRPYHPVSKHDERHQRQNENQSHHRDNFLANDAVIALPGPPAFPGPPDRGTHGGLISHKRGIQKTLTMQLTETRIIIGSAQGHILLRIVHARR
jgi:hypothetical protein